MYDFFILFCVPFTAADVAFYCFVTRPYVEALQKAL